VIGLEVHCQLKTASKLFCGCSTRFGAAPNHHTCPVCLGLPGVLPVLNRHVVDCAVRLALAVGADVAQTSVFARKQYFYPDLPKGYQISQYDKPYCAGGGIKLADGRLVRLTRIHIEEDAGKNVHSRDGSLVDVNRAGIPLLEVVSEPVLHTPEDAVEYLKKLHALVRALDVCDGNLEEGSFRCDANVSLRRRGTTAFGTRCEIKNLNSFRNVERAILAEIDRQREVLEEGGAIVQATMLFDADVGRTHVMRTKEDAHDYRYFPDPDLGPLVITPARVDAVRAAMPELPEAMAARFARDYGLGDYDAGVLTSDLAIARYFEAAVHGGGEAVSPKIVANWVITEVLREANEGGWSLEAPRVTAAALAELMQLLASDVVSGKIAKTVFAEMAKSGRSPKAIVEEQGLVQISDEGAIVALVNRVLDGAADQVTQFLAGKEKLMGFFVGQVMKESRGKMNPGLVNKILKDALDARRK
jgi:aspartyl-tRNA(Asn)/glutamyl-tRNA(Gln) amidotransferase subunit B